LVSYLRCHIQDQSHFSLPSYKFYIFAFAFRPEILRCVCECVTVHLFQLQLLTNIFSSCLCSLAKHLDYILWVYFLTLFSSIGWFVCCFTSSTLSSLLFIIRLEVGCCQPSNFVPLILWWVSSIFCLSR
jgi:hypothetical protein